VPELRELTARDIEHFVEHGFVIVKDCIDRAVMKEWVDRSWARNGYDPQHRATWREGKIHMPNREFRRVGEIAPRALAAMRELVGGVARISDDLKWGDGFVANYRLGDDQPWLPPSPEITGWHKDGDFFLHFLDSPEQGLLSIVLWDDVVARGGGTFIACDSVGVIARFLAEHPQGVEPTGFPFSELIQRCTNFREATGQAGDVYLMHPFMMHASSRNHAGRARLITNPCVFLTEPMRFDREPFEAHSPVERAILRALGKRSYTFQPTAPRRRIVPARLTQQAKLKEEEDQRLAARPAPSLAPPMGKL
jgi:hypothetical protein